MRKPRTFAAEFKRQVVEEMLLVDPPDRPRFVEDTIFHRVFCITGKNRMQGVN